MSTESVKKLEAKTYESLGITNIFIEATPNTASRIIALISQVMEEIRIENESNQEKQ